MVECLNPPPTSARCTAMTARVEVAREIPPHGDQEPQETCVLFFPKWIYLFRALRRCVRHCDHELTLKVCELVVCFRLEMNDVAWFNFDGLLFCYERRLSRIDMINLIDGVGVHRIFVSRFKPHDMEAEGVFSHRFDLYLIVFGQLFC